MPNREIAAAVERWFARHQRPLPWRSDYNPYRVWVSEIMLQQTRMEVVLAYYGRFLERFPDLASLARATDDQVTAAWSGLGYYRRARMLRAGAAYVVEHFGGVIPQTVDELLAIPGIGRYTAGAIASIAHRQKAAIVDGNVARILARIAILESPLGSPALMRDAWSHAEKLVAACKDPRAFNQGLMELGAMVCTPRKPLCMLCPVRAHCGAFAAGRVDELPAPKAKKATRALAIALYLIDDGTGRILMRRESGPLMDGMFHLPHGEASLLSGAPLEVVHPRRIGSFRHTVTTRKIEFTLFAAELPNVLRDSDEYRWIDTDGLSEVPHPSYVAKALRLARNRD